MKRLQPSLRGGRRPTKQSTQIASATLCTPPRNDGRFFYFFILLLLSGCAGLQINYVPLKTGHFAPSRPASDILLTTRSVQEPYEELGIILIRKYPGSLEEEIMDTFRAEAMRRGADAVLKINISKQPVFTLSPFIFSLPFPGIEAKGVAVRFKEKK